VFTVSDTARNEARGAALRLDFCAIVQEEGANLAGLVEFYIRNLASGFAVSVGPLAHYFDNRAVLVAHHPSISVRGDLNSGHLACSGVHMQYLECVGCFALVALQCHKMLQTQ
jgi:hypothetical protein